MSTKTTEVSTSTVTEAPTAVTGFQFHKIVNDRLKEAGFTVKNKTTGEEEPKRIPPQMIYNYIKNGFLKTDKGLINLEEGNKWIEKYFAKLALKAQQSEEVDA